MTTKVKGLAAFTYKKKDKVFTMSYHQATGAAVNNIDEMKSWANMAYAAALRAAAKKYLTQHNKKLQSHEL